VATQKTLQRRAAEELKEWLAVAYESLTGNYRKKPTDRRVLRTPMEVEQCTNCLHWFPWYELTTDADGQSLCRGCASRLDLW
jgi:hypothetical protein